MMRASTSSVPPAANGTSRVCGRLGHSCVRAATAPKVALKAAFKTASVAETVNLAVPMLLRNTSDK